jgi:NADH dehydrogenase (ubiquinone) 1 alpha subcomplex subunit 13
MPVVQDGPPPGGFPGVRFARRLPNTGPSGVTLFAVGTAIMAYGFYKVAQSNKERRALKEEVLQARVALSPFLIAEENRRYAENYRTFREREKYVFDKLGITEFDEPIYKTRWMPPAQPFGLWKYRT